MKDHPEFLDLMAQYVDSRVAEWDAAHPRPVRDESKRPPNPEPIGCHHSLGVFQLSVRNTETFFVIASEGELFSFSLASGHLHQLIEQLLTIQCDVLAFEEWANGGEAYAQWQAKRDGFKRTARIQFITQYEHRGVIAEGAE